MRIALLLALMLTGCKYYGSALPPDYPLSMDVSFDVAKDKAMGAGGVERQLIRHKARPDMERPSYIPEKELAVVAPPKTLLVWTYPHIMADNTRAFGHWSTIFLTDRYEWILPANDRSIDDNVFGVGYGAP